ncbi:MAG: ketoacyl-ACP synthase III [Bryobacterales bacterium]
MSSTKAVIRDVASHLPAARLTNEDLAAREGAFSAEQIFAKTGIVERPQAAPDECASDLAAEAARALFAKSGVDPASIDYVIFCTQSPDYFLPASACVLQRELGLPTACGAIDINQGCSGYVYGLSLAKGLIESGQVKRLLLLTGDTYTKYIHPLDRSVCTLFGDGATATLIDAAPDAQGGLGVFQFGTDGRGADKLIVPAGGFRTPRSSETAAEATDADGNVRSAENLYMNGRDVFRFAISTVPRSFRALLEAAGWTADEVDFLLLHQANRFMLDELVARLKFPKEKTPYRFENLGNTVSSTIPFVLEELLDSGRLKPGARLALLGFGVGYSWGGCTVEWV